MVAVVVLMTLGIACGYLLRKRYVLIRVNQKLIIVSIYFLLFLLGVSIGVNKVIMSNLPLLGVKAIAITAGGVAGSVLLAWVVTKYFLKMGKGQ